MSWYKLEEIRLVQKRAQQSAANADTVSVGAPGVPAGKLWIVTAFSYFPSVLETQTIAIQKYDTKTTGEYAVLNPISLAAGPTAQVTFIEQGMEYLLFPGEYISVYRGNHTAGSTMVASMQIIEVDLPLYTYDEPQEVKRQKIVLSSIRARLGGGSGSRGGGGPAPSGGIHGGRGTPPAI